VAVLAVLVGLGELAIEPAIIAGLALLALAAFLSVRPVRCLRQLQLHIDEMIAGNTTSQSEDTGDALTDPGGGAIGDLTAAFQRLERNWSRDRKTLTNGLAAAATLFDALPDPLMTLDRYSRLIYANAAARMLLAEGRPEGDLRGRDLSAVLRQPVVLEAVDEVLTGATNRAVEFTFADHIDQAFEARVAAITSAEVDDNDAIALLLLRDATTQRRSEQSRADFVANVSHELRTPLTSLTGFIETLRGTAKNDAEARERFLALMATQSGRMGRLVDDLLSLSQIEMNEHTLPNDDIDLRGVIQSVADLLVPQAHERSITVSLELDAITNPVVGDRDELTQLFQNLIENAIKYGHEGTTVHIGSKVAGSGAITISIADQGDGISREHLPRLTERFYRIDTARSRELGGTGLGLAIVKHIVNRHRGNLAINSVEGQGSTFSVTLRFASAANTAGNSDIAAAVAN
jgi:two-component system phosphate regulon sensor histidine kinase PhoR